MKKYKLSKYNVFRQFDDDTYIACNLVEKIFFSVLIVKNIISLSIMVHSGQNTSTK